jgi:hypothetical protein
VGSEEWGGKLLELGYLHIALRFLAGTEILRNPRNGTGILRPIPRINPDSIKDIIYRVDN